MGLLDGLLGQVLGGMTARAGAACPTSADWADWAGWADWAAVGTH